LEYRYVTKYQRPGRPPEGGRALTGAERQARYRQRQAEGHAALQTIADLDLDEQAAIELPRGFGRD
jgi:hypothetical protein